MCVCASLPRNSIGRLCHPRSGDTHDQETKSQL